MDMAMQEQLPNGAKQGPTAPVAEAVCRGNREMLLDAPGGSGTSVEILGTQTGSAGNQSRGSPSGAGGGVPSRDRRRSFARVASGRASGSDRNMVGVRG
jgi:hypothetical protein